MPAGLYPEAGRSTATTNLAFLKLTYFLSRSERYVNVTSHPELVRCLHRIKAHFGLIYWIRNSETYSVHPAFLAPMTAGPGVYARAENSVLKPPAPPPPLPQEAQKLASSPRPCTVAGNSSPSPPPGIDDSKEDRRFYHRRLTTNGRWCRVVPCDPPAPKRFHGNNNTNKDPSSTSPIKALLRASAKKLMFSVFFDMRGVILSHAVSSGKTVTALYYSKVQHLICHILLFLPKIINYR